MKKHLSIAISAGSFLVLGLVGALGTFAVGCGSSGSEGTTPAPTDSTPQVLTGYYAAAGADEPSYNFTDATHYTVTKDSACTFTDGVGSTPGTLPDAGAETSTGDDAGDADGGVASDAAPPVPNSVGNPGTVTCPSSVTDTGTYVLNGATLSLKSDKTGKTTTMPFESLSTEPVTTSPGLTTKDVAPLDLVSDGGALATNGGALVKPTGGFKLLNTSYGRSHQFIIQAKLFIAPIASSAVGSLGGGSIQDFAVSSLSKATNLSFSENPPDGSQASGQFRVWNQFKVDAVCIGTVPTLNVYPLGTDAGYEGPLRGNVFGMPLGKGKALTSTGGNFYEIGSGSPNDAASIAFTVIKSRPSTVIWQAIKGTVTCNEDGTASSAIAIADIKKPGFPTLRVWTQQHDGPTPLVMGAALPGGSGYRSTGAPVQIAQGNFVNLWSLSAVPTYAAFTAPYESTATSLMTMSERDFPSQERTATTNALALVPALEH